MKLASKMAEQKVAFQYPKVRLKGPKNNVVVPAHHVFQYPKVRLKGMGAKHWLSGS